jgi:hypothetical protein
LEVGVENPDEFFAAHSFDRFYAINSGDWGNPNVPGHIVQMDLLLTVLRLVKILFISMAKLLLLT